MTTRKLLAIIIALALIVSLTACSGETIETPLEQSKADTQPEFQPFIIVGEGYLVDDGDDNKLNSRYHQYILYDPATMVMWTFIAASTPLFTMMYNADGTPRLYSPNVQTEIQTFIIVGEGYLVDDGDDYKLNSSYNQYILYDPATMVMWTFIAGGAGGSHHLTVLYNADGTPRVYSPNTKTT